MTGPDPHDTPVTRREFNEALDKIGGRIEELFRAKQVSWPLIIGVLGLALTVLGFGIKNLADVATVGRAAESHGQSIDDFRSRIRGIEANAHAVMVENETQNRWMADVVNLQDQYLETLIRTKHPDLPARSYWPMGQIGQANPINGNGH